MLAIKECLIREGVLNLTSTSVANHGNDTTLAAGEEENQPGSGGGDFAAVAAAADAGVAVNAGNLHHNNKYNDFNVVSNNLRAISANYTVNNDNNRYRSYYDRLAATQTTATITTKPPLALDSQLAKFGEQKSVDTTHSPQNDNKSSNCSLSSASITAKSSCQQASSIYDKTKQQLYQQQQLQRQQQQSKQKEQQQTGTKSSSSSSSARYHGVHPHFHHHTAPAYYTDVNLHIHTPKANDVAALNENYQSVYNTPSQLVNEHYFPKTSTATVVPPPIGTGTAVIGRASTTSPLSVDKRDRERIIAPINEPGSGGSSSNNRSSAAARAAFFRGGSAGTSGYSNSNSKERKSCEPLTKSSPAFGRPTETGNSPTSASAATTIAGRSRNSHRFAGKRRAVRVRSESRPISALYDIICKEKGLDIGTSSNNEDDSSAPSNQDDAHHSSTRSTSKNHKNKSSKEHSHQQRTSSSRNNSLKTSKDYAEISNCLTAFVANSISNYLNGPQNDTAKMDHSNTASGDTAASHDRTKRSHKARTPSGHKKRKDVGGKTKSTVPRRPGDEEPNVGYTSEDSNEQRAHAALMTRGKHRADCSRRMNGVEKKASSLPPQLHDVAYAISSSAVQQQLIQQQKASGQNVTKKCSIHCRCHSGCECRKASSNSYRTSSSHYPYEYHQSSLPPPNLSSGSCSCVRSPSTADDESLGYSPDKLYIEPVNMHLSGIPSSTASGVKNANSSSSGVVLEQTSNLNSTRNSKERISRAHQRRQREEMRRHTDLPDLNSLSPSTAGDVLLQQSAKALSEDEGVSSGVNQQKSHSSRARRFINRPSRTPSRGRTTTGNSAHNSPHPTRRSCNQHPDTTSSASPSPPAANRHTLAVVGADSSDLNSSAAPNTINTSAGVVTIEDVGSASSGDHIAHIQLSPLQIMTNSATPTTSAELRPPVNGSSSALAVGGEVLPAETEVNEEAGMANFGVQVSIAANGKHERKYDVVVLATPKSPHKTPAKPITRTNNNKTTNTLSNSVNKPAIISPTQRKLQQQQQQSQPKQSQQPNNKSNYNNSNANHNITYGICNNNSNGTIICNNSYAMPTETFLLKQKAAAMLAATSNINCNNTNTNSNTTVPAVVVVRKKPLSPLQIITRPPTTSIPTSRPHGGLTTTAHQLSHQHNALPPQQTSDVGVKHSPLRHHSPLLGAPPPLSPFSSIARSPLSPCTSPHYVRPTKASRLRAAAFDKKKCSEDDASQRSRSPCCGSPIITSPCQQIASPKQQSPRLSVSSSSENPHAVVSASSESETKLPAGTTSPTKAKPRLQSSSSNDSTTANKKLVPSVSVSMKQNLSEMQFNGSPKKTTSSKLKKPRSSATPPSPSTECTANFTRSAGRLSTAEESDTHLMLKHAKPLPRPRTSTMKSGKSKSANDLKPSSSDSSPSKTELSPTNVATPFSPLEDRDKSSKRKSNLNRSLNDEATVDSDDSLAARRRRRRELGMVRQLVPSDDPALREMLSPRQNKTEISPKIATTSKPTHNELAYHMEIARRGWDLVNPSVSNRARSETASPKHNVYARESAFREKPSVNRLARRSDTLHLGELRKLRSNDVNRKVNERTKSDLAEIKKIAEQANVEMAMMASGIAVELAAQAVRGGDEFINNDSADQDECVVELATPARYGIGSRGQAAMPPPAPSYSELEIGAKAQEREPSPAKHATFVQEERIYYEPEAGDELAKSISNTTMAGGILRQRILKARSMERDAGHEPPKLSPILRRRSTDDPTYIAVPSATGMHSTSPLTATPNHIVSILKKKDHIAGESSSASSNASPVTFSANVVDTSNKKQKRAGILKKRSSLDESRYYSRSHSPDERSILIKSARRNSLEETAGLQQQQQHGILKQSSYESSKSDGCPSATEPHPHGILKKKDSTSTPSDGGTHAPKHVSISQAVKMAAAELCRETADSQAAGGEYEECGYTPNNEEYEIRPILKLESIASDEAMRPPKPILKKKSSGDSDEYEIRPILKTSRKSSREEFDLGGSISEDGRHYSEPPTVRPILKTDSPSKRRSLGGEELEQEVFSSENLSGHSPGLLKRRTRSLERQEAPVVDLAAALNAIATSQAAPVEFVSTPITTGGNISVAERIKNMEMFLNSNGGTPTTPTDVNISWESPLQSGMTPKLLKPSAIRRDMYRDRYKTQPITNDEKMLFKATASPLDTSTTSAFKPTKSLDAGLNYNTFAHLNAPTAASSASSSSSYALTRCATQPLHGQQHHYDIAGVTTSGGTPLLRTAFGRLNSLSDSYNNSNNNNNTSEQLNLSLGSESERIFEMSGIEDKSVTTRSASRVDEKGAVDTDPSAGGCSLTRKNSVRARANMFQQLQEKTKCVEGSASGSSATAATMPGREERNSPRRASSQLSPTSAMLAASAPLMTSSLIGASSLHTKSYEEPKTPQNPDRTDEEIEPTSLPVSERLRFFTNLTEAANRSTSSSYTRSPSQRFLAASDRCGSANSYSHNNSFTFMPRGSYNGGSTSTSSASVTPTPMECCSPPLVDQQHQLISINEIDSPSQFDTHHHESNISPPAETQESSAFIKLAKSSSQTLLPSVLAQRLAMSAPAPATTAPAITTLPSSLTPMARRIKMKTIGKLLLPQTFLNNERNNQQNISANVSDNGIGVTHNDTCESESGNFNEADNKSAAVPLKKIGKIKSPFIENCLQMQQKHHQLNSKCMKLDHKSTPHNALAALENNGLNSGVSAGGGGGGERDVNSLPPRKPLQTGNAGLPPLTRVEGSEEQNTVSGKENNYCVTNSPSHLMLSPTASINALSEQQTHSPVVEMRKKFTRIMNSSTLSTLSQRHAVHSLTSGISSGHTNAQVHNSSASSAPPTPRNSIIDEKFAKYFGLTPSGSQNLSHTDSAIATVNHKTINVSDHSASRTQTENAQSASLPNATESNRAKRSATNYPPIPPPDFYHTPLGDHHSRDRDSSDDLSSSMDTHSHQVVLALPYEAINYNVGSNSNTPYYTPPSTCPYDIATPTTTTMTAVSSALSTLANGTTNASSSSATNALQRRRDMAKRQRANTTNVTFTPTSSNTDIASSQASMMGTSGSGRARALRSRALTLTHGVPLPEVKRFEDIVVTKEEFQLASKEFERIFLGVI